MTHIAQIVLKQAPLCHL